MLGRKMLDQCGTVKVRVAPLLVLLGAAAGTMADTTFDDVLKSLEPAEEM